MQGTIAQIIALTTWGNLALNVVSQFDAASFYPANSTFVFCEYVKFVDLRRIGNKWEETDYASDPIEWFQRLKQDGVSTLRMRYEPSEGKKLGNDQVTDRMLVGFVGGGGRWLIEAVKPSGSDFWEARWQAGNRDRADNKIWRVTYGRIAANAKSLSMNTANADEMKARLVHNLSEIAEFARAHDADGFSKAFDSGLARLSSNDPYSGLYHPDLAPQETLPAYANQLLGAAQAAWVFGGMGSWNDLSFEGRDQARYDELSEELYRLLNAAIVVAVNSSSPAGPITSSKAWWQLWK